MRLLLWRLFKRLVKSHCTLVWLRLSVWHIKSRNYAIRFCRFFGYVDWLLTVDRSSSSFCKLCCRILHSFTQMKLYAKLLLLCSISVVFIAVRWSASPFNEGELNGRLSVYLCAVIKCNIRRLAYNSWLKSCARPVTSQSRI